MSGYRVRYRNKNFKGQKVELDGKEFIQCDFERCLIVLETGDTDISGCRFKGCKLFLKGNAYKVAKVINMVTAKEVIRVLDVEDR